MSDLFDWLTVFDWLSPLLHLAQNASGRVSLQGTARAVDLLERAGVSVGAPILDHASGTYLFTVRRSDLARVRRVLARAGVEVW